MPSSGWLVRACQSVAHHRFLKKQISQPWNWILLLVKEERGLVINYLPFERFFPPFRLRINRVSSRKCVYGILIENRGLLKISTPLSQHIKKRERFHFFFFYLNTAREKDSISLLEMLFEEKRKEFRFKFVLPFGTARLVSQLSR